MLKSKPYVDFDPNNREHLEAYASLKFQGVQTNLRFIVEEPFTNVLSSMENKICLQYLKDNLGV